MKSVFKVNRFNSLGFSQIIILVLLLIGILVAVYLVGRNTNLFPKADLQTISIIGADGNPLTKTDSPTVKVRVNLPWQIKVAPTSVPTPGPTCNPKSFNKDTWKIVKIGACTKGQTNLQYQCQKVTKVVSEYCTINQHDVHVPGVECGRAIVLAEDPGFKINVQEFKYLSNPQVLDYTFSDPGKLGVRTLYAKFNAYDENDNMKTVMAVPAPVTIDYQPIAKKTGASFVMSPKTGTFNRGCSYSADILIDTGGYKSDAAEAVFTYESSKLNITEITNGNFFASIARADISSNMIDIQGYSLSAPVSGKGSLAKLKFSVPTTAQVGATSIKFDFDPNNPDKTTDSNIVESDTIRELLKFVEDGNYTIGNGACNP